MAGFLALSIVVLPDCGVPSPGPWIIGIVEGPPDDGPANNARLRPEGAVVVVVVGIHSLGHEADDQEQDDEQCFHGKKFLIKYCWDTEVLKGAPGRYA